MILCYSNGISQDLPQPVVSISSMIFSDSTRVEVTTSHDSGKIMMEIGSGSADFFREYKGPFYINNTKTLRFKLSHPDYYDSELVIIKVFKKAELEHELVGDYPSLGDGKRGSAELNDLDWNKNESEKVIFEFISESKKVEEVELLSYVKTSEGILPPKKVVLYAHLKNGKKVHIRSANTIGQFKNSEAYWSHTLRLIGKPKLKKILKKTIYFSIEITPHFSEDKPLKLYFDEILVR